MKKHFFISFFISLLIFSSLFIIFKNNIAYTQDNIDLIASKYDFYDIQEDKEIKLKKKPKLEDLPKGIQVNPKNELLFLMMGVDSEKVETSKGTRTDTIMLCKMNFSNGNIDILSIPRDTRVNVRGKKDKVNHAHAYGGTDLAKKTIEDFLNINIDYYVKVDYRVVKAIVDAIGGVEIDVPIDMHYDDPTATPPLSIHLNKGLQVLDGQKAHDFLRYRKGYPDGDIGRVKAQQYFMKELLKQLVEPSNILKLPQIIKSYYDYVETNIPLNTILKAATNAYKINIDNFKTQTIPGVGKMLKVNGRNVSYYIYDENKTKQIIEEDFKSYLK